MSVPAEAAAAAVQSPLLSIVVPTLDRRHLLEKTLSALSHEILGLEESVELVVVNNASTDDTASFLSGRQFETSVRVVSFSERVEADSSFHRCVRAARGQYINIFGDDDLPMPGFVRRIVDVLTAHRPDSFLYINRLIGDENLHDIAELAHPYNDTDLEVLDVGVLAARFTHALGCITSLVFNRDCWDRGDALDLESFKGYRFLARLCAGAKGSLCVYLGMPAFIQRRGRQSWKANWPRYWLVSMPGLLSALESEGIAKGALRTWQQRDTSMRRVAIDCVVAKAYGYKSDDDFWTQAAAFQPRGRALAIELIRRAIPRRLAKMAYFAVSKNHDSSAG